MATEFEMYSFNCRGMKNHLKLLSALRKTKNNNIAKIICIQETKIERLLKPHLQILNQMNLKYYHTPAEKTSGGLLMILSPEIKVETYVQNRNIQIITTETNQFANVYLNQNEHEKCVEDISTLLKTSVNKNKNFSMAGDFNCFPTLKDSSRHNNRWDPRIKKYEFLQEALSDFDLSDLGTFMDNCEHTHLHSQSNTTSRIDLLLTNNPNAYNSFNVLPMDISDHSMIFATTHAEDDRGESF